jgi:hypothetical protein
MWTGLTADNGKNWMPLAKSPTVMAIGSKTWGQRTDDGRYVLVYNHSPIRSNRFPMTLMTGDDGHEFDNLLCLQGEVPIERYEGLHKPWGSQYIRGIMPGNGNPPGDHLWNVYSMNKEDIWITRSRLPISGTVDEYVSQDFEKAGTEADLELWNLYMPKWAPIYVTAGPGGKHGKCLQLSDKDPYDYALAERVFPESKKVTVKFDIMTSEVANGRMEIDVVAMNGQRAVSVILGNNGMIYSLDRGKAIALPVANTGKWMSFKLDIDCASRAYTFSVDGKKHVDGGSFVETVPAVQRLIFRTGVYRRVVPTTGKQEKDVPNSGVAVPQVSYYVDNVSIAP